MYGPDKKDHNIETEHLLTMSEQLFGTKPRSPETPFEMPETPSLQAGTESPSSKSNLNCGIRIYHSGV